MSMILGFVFLAASVATFVGCIRTEMKRSESEKGAWCCAHPDEKSGRGVAKI